MITNEKKSKSMALDWLGGAIGGVANAVSSVITGNANRKAQARENEKDRHFNAEQAQISRDWQEEQYLKYESPAAQMQQLKAAGLNPLQGVSSQSVGSGSTASASSSSLPQAQAPDFSFLGNLNILAQQVKSMRLDNDIKKEEKVNVERQNEKLRLENMKASIEANDWESYWQLYKTGLHEANKGLKYNAEKLKVEKDKAYEEFRLARVNANNAEDAESNGINPIITDDETKRKNIEHIQEIIKSLKEDVSSKKRANYLGEIYDPLIAELEHSLKSYETYSSKVDNLVTTELGYKVEQIPPVLLPLLTRFVVGIDHGDYSEDSITELKDAFKDFLDNELFKYVEVSDPHFISRLDALEHNLDVSEHNLKVAEFNWQQKVDAYRLTTEGTKALAGLSSLLKKLRKKK